MLQTFCLLAPSYSEGGGSGRGKRQKCNFTNIAVLKFRYINDGHPKYFEGTTHFIQCENELETKSDIYASY
jgi:hypothetical protein